MGRDTKPLLWVSSKTQRTKEPAAAMSSKKSPLRSLSAGPRLLSKGEVSGAHFKQNLYRVRCFSSCYAFFFLRIPFRADFELFRFSRKDCNQVQRRKEGLFLVWGPSGTDLPVASPGQCSRGSGVRRLVDKNALKALLELVSRSILFSPHPPLFLLSWHCSVS